MPLFHLAKFFGATPETDMRGKIGGQEGSAVYVVHNASQSNFDLNLGNEKEAYFIQAYFGPVLGDGATRVGSVTTETSDGATVSVTSGIKGVTGTFAEAGENAGFTKWLRDLRERQGSDGAYAILKAIYTANLPNSDLGASLTTQDGDAAPGLSADLPSGVELDIQQLQQELKAFMQGTENTDLLDLPPDIAAQNTPANLDNRPVVKLALELAQDDLDTPMYAAE